MGGFADEFVADLQRSGAPEYYDPETLKQLAQKRDPKVRDQIIMQLALTVHRQVLKYRGRANADDILSEAILCLVECADRWPEVADDDDIARYVEFSVKKRVKDFIDDDAVLKIPGRRVREKVAAGEEVTQPKVFVLSGDEREADASKNHAPGVPPDRSFDVWEFLDSRDPQDRVVVEMRIAGHSADEIAESLGTCRATVFNRLKELEKAFESCTN